MDVPDRIASAIETISDGFALLDGDKRFVLINTRFRQIYGQAADMLAIGTSYEDFARRLLCQGAPIEEARADPHLEERVREHMARLATPGPPIEQETTDGRWIRIADYRTGDGGTVCVRTDITERKQRERALAESEERFRRLSEITFEAVLILDKGIIVDHNLALCQLSGFRSDELIGKPTLDLLAPEYRDFARERIANRDERPYAAIGLRKDGTRIPIELHFRHVDHAGQSLRVVAVRDVSEQRFAEQALAESEARTRAIIETALDAIVTFDADGTIIEFNPMAERLFRLGRLQALGRRIGETMLPPDGRTGNESGPDASALIRFLKTGEAPPIDRRIELEAVRADGERFPAELTMTELRLRGRRLFTAFIRDLTEAKRLEREMAEQRQRLHQSEKLGALGSLLAGVAHELNNPLSVVVAQAALLEETAADDRVAKRGQRIRAAAERCATIVRSFLAMARQRQPQRTAVTAGPLIDEVLELVGYGLRSAGITVHRDIPADLPPIWADAGQLNQVLTNLIVNAQQAMQDASGPGTAGSRSLTLTVRHEPATRSLRFDVIDTGPGVPPELRDRIFEPFYTTKPVGYGTGVGLSVCHGIVDSYGGSIGVDDTPGGGARFTVRLPLGSPDGTAGAGTESGTACRPDGCRVLVVDDEPDIAATLAEILERQGHRVDIAESGGAALGLIAGERYDLILSDLRMPGIDGPALYRSLSAERPALARRMIIITGDTLNGSARLFLQESGLPRLEKPFGTEEVRRVVGQVLARA